MHEIECRLWCVHTILVLNGNFTVVSSCFLCLMMDRCKSEPCKVGRFYCPWVAPSFMVHFPEFVAFVTVKPDHCLVAALCGR